MMEGGMISNPIGFFRISRLPKKVELTQLGAGKLVEKPIKTRGVSHTNHHYLGMA